MGNIINFISSFLKNLVYQYLEYIFKYNPIVEIKLTFILYNLVTNYLTKLTTYSTSVSRHCQM